MPEGTTSSQLNKFEKAYPKSPMTSSERALTNDAISGTITMPIYLQSSLGDQYANKDAESATICTIPFHIENNFSFSLGNDWGQLVSADLLDTFNFLFNAGQQVFNSGAAQISFMSKQMQLAMWKGSKQPEFSVDMTFVCTQRNYNPVNIILALSEAALPRDLTEAHNQKATEARTGGVQTIGDLEQKTRDFANQQQEGLVKNLSSGAADLMSTVKEGIENTGLLAPLYYAPAFVNGKATIKPENSLTLQIGRWFRAPNLIVTDISNIEFSKEIIAPPTEYGEKEQGMSNYSFSLQNQDWGFPLYAKCSLKLKPITYITADEFRNYFIPTPNDQGGA